MQLRDGTCGSFWLASLLCCLWELDPVPSCHPSHTLLGRGRACVGASGTLVPPCHPLLVFDSRTAQRHAAPPPTALGGGRAGRYPLTPSSLSLCTVLLCVLFCWRCSVQSTRSDQSVRLIRVCSLVWRSAGRRACLLVQSCTWEGGPVVWRGPECPVPWISS